jgi:hypothetical protein
MVLPSFFAERREAFQPAFSKWSNVGIAPSMLNLCFKK